ncbi:hypothetical protein [Sporosarcina psychrophila]|uniref:Uncharacterized protein n=1 Tax=Sporosarcina psychrophila TaxID=1476 RepID=A0ABV2KBS4_SPOPS
MAQYKSKFKELGFYVDGELKRFSNGVFSTDDKADITVLDTLSDATKTEEVIPVEKPKPAAKAKPSGK